MTLHGIREEFWIDCVEDGVEDVNGDESDGGGEGEDWLVSIPLWYGNIDPGDEFKQFTSK